MPLIWPISDWSKVCRFWYKRADAGHVEDMVYLGWFYHSGISGDQDYQKARHWYEKAAAAGNMDAMNSLGCFYRDGHGVTQDYQQARLWYEKAVAPGIMNTSWKPWLYGDAIYNLGSIYRDGHGVTQDYQQARLWYEKAAAAGNGDAMYNLGCFYRDGHGVTLNYRKARLWYKKAAAAGNVDAMYNLSCFYRHGHGVAQDCQQARLWYEKADEKAAAAYAAVRPRTALDPVSRPEIFRTLKKYEATLPAGVQHGPNSTSTITAWRAWRVEHHGPKLGLLSTGGRTLWEPKIRQEARCITGGKHIAPDWNCRCGFWAFKSVEELLQVLRKHDYHDFGVLGTVSLWGKVIETKHGFRAQYAYPKELWLDEGMLELGWIYKVPIRAATEGINR